MTTIPFTYLIKCIPTNQYYYGVRWAKGCNPSDLWTTYFTSSKHIKQLIEDHGTGAFEFEVRQTFDSTTKAKIWEARVLQRLHVVKRSDFINKTDLQICDFSHRCWINRDGQSKFIDCNEVTNYLLAGWKRGRVFSAEHKRRNSLAKKEWSKTHDNPMKGRRRKDNVPPPSGSRGMNGNSKPISVRGVEFSCVLDAMDHFNLSRYKIMQEATEIQLRP